MALYVVSPSPYPRDMDDFSLKILHNTMFKSMKRRRKTLVCENLVLNLLCEVKYRAIYYMYSFMETCQNFDLIILGKKLLTQKYKQERLQLTS